MHSSIRFLRGFFQIRLLGVLDTPGKYKIHGINSSSNRNHARKERSLAQLVFFYQQYLDYKKVLYEVFT